MFKKLGISFITATVASTILTSCSSDSYSTGPADVPQDSSIVTPESSSDVAVTRSSSSSSIILNNREEPSSSSSSVILTPEGEGSGTSADESPASSSSIKTPADISSSSNAEVPSSSSATASDDTSNDTPAHPTAFWSDEFQGDALDLTKWRYETGATGWGNNELQYYTDRAENAYVADGILHIAAKKESYEGASYTSARLITKGKFEFAYGTIEARIALPVGKGIWPAFWMLGANIDDVSWPLCGEIDIIEAVNDESVVYGTHHWSHEGNHAEYGNSTKEYYGTSYPMDITDFHVYKTVWTEKSIAMYVDDFKYQEIDITLKKDSAGNNIASDMETFHKNFFFILNVAVGGNWPGFEIDDSQFPNEMLVDYIRVYK